MIKESDKYSDIEKIVKMLDGTSFAIHEANIDKENFERYKDGNIKEFSKDTIKNMRLLHLLQRLGYPMEELGTYLFKDVIVEVYDSIQDESGKKDIDKCNNIMIELNNPFSNLYHYIAREWKELGIKPFHLYIKRAIDRIDYNSIDKDLSKRIYGINPDNNNYGLHAFQIAAYALDESSYVDTLQYQQPKTKELKPNDN